MSSAKQLALKTYTQVILHGLNGLYLELCMCIQILICIQQQLMKGRDHEQEKVLAKIYGRIWREKKERQKHCN